MRKRLGKEVEKAVLWADFTQKQLQEWIGVSISDECFDIATEKMYESFSQGEGRHLRESEKADYIVLNFILSTWKKWKTVYLFDPDFLEALEQTEDTPLYTEVLQRLPCPAFYIHPSKEGSNGLFCSVETQNSGDCLVSVSELSQWAGSPEKIKTNDFGFMQFSLWFHNGETINEAIDAVIVKLVDAARGQRDGLVVSDFDELVKKAVTSEFVLKAREDYYRAIKRALLCAYYLAAQNAEIKQVKLDKKDRPTRHNGSPLNVKAWEVGFRMGKALGELPKETEHHTGEDRIGTAKRPHVRRAHWHHYWVGKGRTKLTLKWLAPFVVNGTADDLPATGHEVII